jgi:deoxyadenosine/deoxycytidine kinase
MSGKMIVLAGNVGAGKSTYTRILAEKMNFVPYYESVDDNPFLEDFYYNQKQWSYHLQTYFLFHRFKSIKAIIESGKNAILDRTIYEDAEIFAKNLHLTGKMTDKEYSAYRDIFYTMLEFIKKPHLTIYIDTNVETIKNRIAKRGREMEMQVPEEYWKQLDGLYKLWISKYNHSNLLIVDGNENDIVEHENFVDELIEQIEDKIYKNA